MYNIPVNESESHFAFVGNDLASIEQENYSQKGLLPAEMNSHLFGTYLKKLTYIVHVHNVHSTCIPKQLNKRTMNNICQGHMKVLQLPMSSEN